MSDAPTVTDPDKYSVVFENDRVRVLESTTGPAIARRRTAIPTASCTRSARSSDA